MLVEGELDRSIERNEVLFVGLWLANGVVRCSRADYILLTQKIDVLLLRFLRTTRDRGVGKNNASLRLGAGGGEPHSQNQGSEKCY